jgi:hypothetical protein
MGDVVGVFGQGFVVVGMGSVGVEREEELVDPAESSARSAERVAVRAYRQQLAGQQQKHMDFYKCMNICLAKAGK